MWWRSSSVEHDLEHNKRQVSDVFSMRECQFCHQPIPSTGCSNRKHLFTISSVLLFVWLGCNYRMMTQIRGMNARGRHQQVSFLNKKKYFGRHKPETVIHPKGKQLFTERQYINSKKQQREIVIIPRAVANNDRQSLLWWNILCHCFKSFHCVIAEELIGVGSLWQ